MFDLNRKREVDFLMGYVFWVVLEVFCIYIYFFFVNFEFLILKMEKVFRIMF